MQNTAASPGSKRWRIPAVSAVVVVVAAAGWWSVAERRPSLEIPQEVPAEVTELSLATWKSYLAAFPAQRNCIGTVTMRLTRSVDGGDAMYRPPERTIYVEIPTTPERFPESLAHELGHHLESACNAEGELGEAFRASQGLPPDSAWSGSEPWYDSPSEHFAETVVEIVDGERITHQDIVILQPSTIDLVRAWGATGATR
jgi:acetylornithine deacetylase/succinyl-diaminopimelate desuccinylase-like protein